MQMHPPELMSSGSVRSVSWTSVNHALGVVPEALCLGVWWWGQYISQNSSLLRGLLAFQLNIKTLKIFLINIKSIEFQNLYYYAQGTFENISNEIMRFSYSSLLKIQTILVI